jgi:outer membrane protein assembly factor BamB
MTNRWLLVFAAVLLSPLAASSAFAGAREPGWPQWLGPWRNGATTSAGLLAGDGNVRLRAAWKRPLGDGLAGLAVADGRLFTLESDGERDYAVAFAVEDGRPIWRTDLGESLAAADRGPQSTPAVHTGLVFTLTPACQLRALDAGTGKTAWHVDLKERYGAAARRGCLSSPLIDGDRLVVQPGNPEDHRVLSLHARNGELAWSGKGVARASYSSPTLMEIGGERHVVINHTDATDPDAPRSGFTAFRSRDGSMAWHTTFEKEWSTDTPVVDGARLVLATWNDLRAYRVAAGADGFEASHLWTTAPIKAYVSPPVVHGEHLYGFGDDYLRAVRLADGAEAWAEKLYPGSVILVDGHLVVLSTTSGLVRIVEASPVGYRERARLEVLARGARAEIPPSFADGRIFVRNDEELVAIAIEK